MNRLTALLVICCFLLPGCAGNSGGTVYSGLFEATEIDLATSESGKIMRFPFQEGDMLESGTVVVELDSELLEIEKATYGVSLQELEVQKLQNEALAAVSRATVAGAKREHDRLRGLYAKKSATDQQLDNAKTALDQASAQHEANKAALNMIQYKKALLEEKIRFVEKRIADCSIRSPVRGTLIKKFFEASEIARNGVPIGTVADLSVMELVIYITAEDLGKVKIGDVLSVRVDSHPGALFDGNVIWISDKAEFTPKNVQTRESRSEMVYGLKLRISNSDGIFKIGMPAEVVWPH